MNEQAQTIAEVIRNLRALFHDKDRLVGVDDWDCFIGILMTLEALGNELQQRSEETWQTEQ